MHYRHSLDRARQQNALSWEFRAATSLARLWHEQGRDNDARAALMPVYARFTEGFTTTDLRTAKALIDKLNESQHPRARSSAALPKSM
jgi:predicted ATPase